MRWIGALDVHIAQCRWDLKMNLSISYACFKGIVQHFAWSYIYIYTELFISNERLKCVKPETKLFKYFAPLCIKSVWIQCDVSHWFASWEGITIVIFLAPAVTIFEREGWLSRYQLKLSFLVNTNTHTHDFAVNRQHVVKAALCTGETNHP